MSQSDQVSRSAQGKNPGDRGGTGTQDPDLPTIATSGPPSGGTGPAPATQALPTSVNGPGSGEPSAPQVPSSVPPAPVVPSSAQATVRQPAPGRPGPRPGADPDATVRVPPPPASGPPVPPSAPARPAPLAAAAPAAPARPVPSASPATAPFSTSPDPRATGADRPVAAPVGAPFGPGAATPGPAPVRPPGYDVPAGPGSDRSPMERGSAGEPDGPRKVRLTVARVDPWSAMKMSFLLSVAFAIASVVGVVVVWEMLDIMGVFDAINGQLRGLGGSGSKWDLNDYVGLGRVVSIAVVVSVFNVIVTMAIATLGAVLYNISSSLVGGLGVTLSDD